ncbi:MAG: Undecaprenyl-diphosphatase [Clostridia bacterium 62_21]|nr:MAG: Undecaprenyl-diphosphatase [Clostridia bacterium 62_21]HAG07000.1 undecaprenyl-diphosphatase UppP [Peptococcaceae bacterium]
MEILHAVLLGLVQGLGEFLPISSSAHLVLVPWLFGWRDPGLAFDVALHVGTLFAVVAYFWRDWLVLLHHGLTARGTREAVLFWYLVAATVPGALAGWLLEDYAETVFRTPLLVGTMLIVLGVVLYLADHLGRRLRQLGDITLGQALLIGVAQAFAIIPGVSRSGATITAARLLGIEREAATRFSFLLSTPIIFGAGVMQLKDITLADLNLPFVVGVAVSAATGFLAIGFLLRYVTTRNFNIFVWYRLALGLSVLAVVVYRG